MKKTISLLLTICMALSFSGCHVLGALFGGYAPPYYDPNDYPEYPDYRSDYTEEEHIQRLTTLTENGAWKNLKDAENKKPLGDMITVNVELVYAFYDNDPEFFLIDMLFENEGLFTMITEMGYTNRAYYLGYILNDEYYIIYKYYGDTPWDIAGYSECKKYFGSYYFAVELDGVMTAIFREYRTNRLKEEFMVLALTEKEEFNYMQYDYLTDRAEKYTLQNSEE